MHPCILFHIRGTCLAPNIIFSRARTCSSPVLLDISYSILQVTQSLCRILPAKQIRTRWIFHLASTQLPKELAVWYLHNLRMRSSGLLVIFLGKSIFSMPFRMKVYVIIWSLPENGGLVGKEEKHGKVIPPALIYRSDGVL